MAIRLDYREATREELFAPIIRSHKELTDYLFPDKDSLLYRAMVRVDRKNFLTSHDECTQHFLSSQERYFGSQEAIIYHPNLSIPTPCCSMSSPKTIRALISLLKLKDGHKVCEVGFGSGYSTMILAHMNPSGKIIAHDVYHKHFSHAKKKFANKSFHNVNLRCTNALDELLEEAPFDRILFNVSLLKPDTRVRREALEKIGSLVDNALRPRTGRAVFAQDFRATARVYNQEHKKYTFIKGSSVGSVPEILLPKDF